MAERRYILTRVDGFSPRFDLQTVIAGRHAGFREFPTVDAARATIADGLTFDRKHGHTSKVVDYTVQS